MTNDSDPSKQELLDRVEELESTVEKMLPSRREALKLGAAGAASVGGVSLLSDSADASTRSAGQIGDAQNRPDVFADTVDLNSLNGVSAGGALTVTRAFLGTSGSNTQVPFDLISFDPDSNFDTQTGKYIAPESGIYQAHCGARLDGTGGNITLELLAGNDTFGISSSSSKDQFDTESVQGITEVSSGTEIFVENNPAVPLGVGSENTYFEIIRLQ
jgi:hypothetical protein